MAVKPIATVPNKVLTTKTEKIKSIDADAKALAKDLLDTIKLTKKPEGAGLAANQIGVAKRMCVVRNFVEDPVNFEGAIAEEYVLINPRITSASKETELDWEGCLSVPNSYGRVERFKKIKVTALDLSGQEIKIKANGYFARTIQHEINHLDGILFTQKVVGPLITEEELGKQP